MRDSTDIVNTLRSGSDEQFNCAIILGPTATGKTALAVRVAEQMSGEIISADSRQVYRGLDIGSGKDLSEYTVPYHLIDIADVSTEYSVFNYQEDFYRVFAQLTEHTVFPVIAGGTGMYIDCIIRGYELQEVPVNNALREKLKDSSMSELTEYLFHLKANVHNRTDLTERPRLLRAVEIAEFRRVHESGSTDSRRAPICPLIIGNTFPRDVLRKRITLRLRQRMKNGLIEEVAALHERGISWERLERLGLEYRFVAEFLQGKIPSQNELFTKLAIAIGQFAKRQETWFRGMERKGVRIEWLERDDS